MSSVEIPYKEYKQVGHPIIVKFNNEHYLGALFTMDSENKEYIKFTGGFDRQGGWFRKRFVVDHPVMEDKECTMKEFNPNRGNFDFANFPKDVMFYTRVFDLDKSERVEIEART